MSTYVYQPYPRRLYLNGEVIPGDLHATNSVVVNSEEEEAAQRALGYRKAYEPAPPPAPEPAPAPAPEPAPAPPPEPEPAIDEPAPAKPAKQRRSADKE